MTTHCQYYYFFKKKVHEHYSAEAVSCNNDEFHVTSSGAHKKKNSLHYTLYSALLCYLRCRVEFLGGMLSSC